EVEWQPAEGGGQPGRSRGREVVAEHRDRGTALRRTGGRPDVADRDPGTDRVLAGRGRLREQLAGGVVRRVDADVVLGRERGRAEARHVDGQPGRGDDHRERHVDDGAGRGGRAHRSGVQRRTGGGCRGGDLELDVHAREELRRPGGYAGGDHVATGVGFLGGA